MNYFFVDYENVQAGGISNNLSMLCDGDVVCVMFSQNCKNVTFDVIEAISMRGARLEALSAGTGAKNALDFQLSSYLGFTVGRTFGENNKFYIVSKDTGYDRICEFWKARGVSVERIINLGGEVVAPGTEPAKTKTSKNRNRRKNRKNLENQKAEIAQFIDLVEAAEPITEEEAVEVLDEISGAIPEAPKKESPSKEMESKEKSTKEKPSKEKTPAKKSKVAEDDIATEAELRECLSEDEYSAEILEIFNAYKTKLSINNAINKSLKNSQKSSTVYKKLKPLLKSKHKN